MNEDNLLFIPNLNKIYNNYLQGIMSLLTQPTPAPTPAQPQGLESLLTNIGVDPSYFNMYTQGRGPTDHELDGSESGAGGSGSRDLGEQYSDPGMPSFLGFTGDLGATTGRTIRVDSDRADDVIRRAETYQDVLNAYRRHKNSVEQA